MGWPRFRFLLPLALVLICGSLLTDPQAQEIDWNARLPAGPGKAYVEALCSGCHSLGKILMLRRSESEWMAVVGKMVGNEGAPISEDEVAKIVSYLGAHFSPKSATDTEEDAGSSAYPEPETIDWAMMLPDGPGKGRVLAYCTSCHGLKIVVQARKSRDAWFNNITWMADDFGAPVPEEEIPLLADYLSQHYSQR